MNIVNKIKEMLGMDIEKTFTVKWRCDQDGQVRIVTPFCPGRVPQNYGMQRGIQIGDSGICDITILQSPSNPSNVCFKVEGER